MSSPVSASSALPTCDQVGCPGHLGKFDSCLSEAIYVMTLDDADATTGSVDFEGHYSLVILAEPHVEDLLDDASPDFTGDRPTLKVTVPAGQYISHSASSGAVSLWTYPTEAEARAVFAEAEARYSEWDDDDQG